MSNYPCQNCKDRHLGCHGECAKYQTASEESLKEKPKHDLALDYEIERTVRTKWRRNR